MGWLISLIIAGGIIYYLLVGTRAGDDETAGVDRGDLLLTPATGDVEAADELHIGEETEDGEDSDERVGIDRGEVKAEFVDDEEYAEQVEPELTENLDEGEYEEADEDLGHEETAEVEDGMLLGKDTGLRVDEEALYEARRDEGGENGLEEDEDDEAHIHEAMANLNMVGDDFGMVMGRGREGDPIHPDREESLERILEDDHVDEEYGEELFNGDELGGIRYDEDADRGGDSPAGMDARMHVDLLEDETYMNAEEVDLETRNERRNSRRRRRRRDQERNNK